MCKDVSMKDDVFAVIADPTRRHILQALAVERLAVGELVEELGVSQPTVSKHLKVLRTAGLVETEAVGQKRFYSITPTPLTTVTDWVDGLLGAPAAETETAFIPEEPEEAPAPVVDVPHPNTAGITFTPLTPFTPVLDNRVDEDIVESQEAQEAASQESQEVAAQEAIRQVVADSEARARVTDSQAYSPAGEETGDDRGLLAKLTRWGRRSSR